jgi:CubicO group peptidase (beta-lactamase class C family)
LLCYRMDEIVLMNIVHFRESGLRIAVSLTVVLVLISVRSPAQSKPQSEASAPYNFDSIRIYVRNAMKRKKDRVFPSLAIAVAKDGKIIWEEGFGWADVKKKIRATPDTMYSLASISKPVTATGVLRLVQEGKVDLDRPINDYLGNQGVTALAGNARDATVRRVLSHKSGLPEYVHFFYEDEDYTPLSADETIAHYGILVNPPGDVFCYSNLGFGILGDLIARVSNTTYASYMQSEVFTPLGMTHTSVGITRQLQGYAAMAALYAKGRLRLNEEFPHEGILGTIFAGRIVRETQVGAFRAIVPTLSGSAWITGFASYVVDPEDPFPEGFTVGDIWGAAMDRPLT